MPPAQGHTVLWPWAKTSSDPGAERSDRLFFGRGADASGPCRLHKPRAEPPTPPNQKLRSTLSALPPCISSTQAPQLANIDKAQVHTLPLPGAMTSSDPEAVPSGRWIRAKRAWFPVHGLFASQAGRMREKQQHTMSIVLCVLSLLFCPAHHPQTLRTLKKHVHVLEDDRTESIITCMPALYPLSWFVLCACSSSMHRICFVGTSNFEHTELRPRAMSSSDQGARETD